MDAKAASNTYANVCKSIIEVSLTSVSRKTEESCKLDSQFRYVRKPKEIRPFINETRALNSISNPCRASETTKTRVLINAPRRKEALPMAEWNLPARVLLHATQRYCFMRSKAIMATVLLHADHVGIASQYCCGQGAAAKEPEPPVSPTLSTKSLVS